MLHQFLALLTLMTSSVVERTIVCSDGIKLALRQWKTTKSVTAVDYKASSAKTAKVNRLLCLHGWLDNAASFHILGPKLAQTYPTAEVVALDFPGHGLSSHKSSDGPTQLLAEYAFYVAETMQELNWWEDNNDNPITLIGHSMGAGVSTLVAAAYPEKVDSLILIEGVGPLPRNARDCAQHIRKACDKRMKVNRILCPNATDTNDMKNSQSPKKQARVYASIDHAVNARVRTPTFLPGNQYISREGATALVQRATNMYPDGKVQFKHDFRLQWPSLQYMTMEQLKAIMQDVQCPTCLILAEDGYPIDEKLQELVEEYLKLTTKHTFPGSHHLHCDPDNVSQVFEAVVQFIQMRDNTEPW